MEREVLEKKIDAWMEISEDENFDAYLRHVKTELSKPDADVVHLEENFRKNLELYWKNQGIRQKNREMEQKSQQMAEQSLVAQQSGASQPQGMQQTNTTEFKIGAGVLSVVGGVFILIALVILGREFLSSFLQGMGLYICALVVLLFAELFLYQRQPKIATIFTGIGIGGLYLITIINYLSLKILPVGMAIGIAAVIGVTAVLLGQKKEGAVIRIINILGLYICMTPFLTEKGTWQFIAVAATIGIVNLMSLFIHAEAGRTAAEVIQIVCVGLYTWIMGGITVEINNFSNIFMKTYALFYLAVMICIFLKMKKEAAQLWVWGIFTFLLSIGTLDRCDTWLIWVFLGIFAVFLAGACWLARRMEYKEVLYSVVSVALVLAVKAQVPAEADSIVMMGMLVALAAIFLFVPQLCVKRKNIVAWVTLGILGGCSLLLPVDIHIPESVRYLESGLGYQYVSLKVEYWICVWIGILAILLFMRDKIGIPKKWRGITLAGYLTYMLFMAGIKERLMVSILLMAVALISIAAGFIQKQKAARIYGLCLSLIVCVKLVLWDCWGESSLYRMLTFLVVGVLALVISLVYIVLEKKR